jgi:hypothetical protein
MNRGTPAARFANNTGDRRTTLVRSMCVNSSCRVETLRHISQ